MIGDYFCHAGLIRSLVSREACDPSKTEEARQQASQWGGAMPDALDLPHRDAGRRRSQAAMSARL